MREQLKFYIDGAWVEPAEARTHDVIDPATEQVSGRISLGSAADVDKAVAAARRAFETFGQTSREERIALLERVVTEYQKRLDDLADAVTAEMGAVASLAKHAHAPIGLQHFMTALEVLRDYPFEETRHGATRIVKEPVGVCGMITPWNWPMNQTAAKVAPALTTGNTIVLKPSEYSPFSAAILAEILDAAGVPAGVFNLINGDGPGVGAVIAAHPDVDLVSFTGSTRAGVAVAKAAADTVKRVHQELGGKSPNIILDSADLPAAVAGGVKALMVNAGQSCNAPTRMLVPESRMDEAIEAARQAVDQVKVGPPGEKVHLGPVVNRAQWDRIQGLIQKGIDEGAELVVGGAGKPEGLETGYYVKPTVFARARNDMTIAREEIFGPVLTIIGYKDEADAIRIANDTPYGLAAYVQSKDLEHARRVASKLRAGQVNINYAAPDRHAPFGGYKQSGNGREWGEHAFAEFLETKAVLGYGEAA